MTAKPKNPGPTFILPRQPEPGDDRPRNAFGYLIGFGEAKRRCYEEQDERNKETPDGKDARP